MRPLPPHLLAALLVAASVSPAAPQSRQERHGKTAYFGSLHTHSVLSGNVKTTKSLPSTPAVSPNRS